MDELMPEPILSTDGLVVQMETTAPPGATRPPRRRTSRLLMVVLVGALAALGAGAALARQASTERKVAYAQRDQAQAELGAQQDRNDATKLEADLNHQSAQAYLAAVGTPLGTAQQIKPLVDEQLSSLQILQESGEAGKIVTYNRAVDAGNANLKSYNAALDQWSSQLEALPAP